MLILVSGSRNWVNRESAEGQAMISKHTPRGKPDQEFDQILRVQKIINRAVARLSTQTKSLMDVPAGSAYLSVGQSMLRRWIAEGKLRVVRLGRRVLIRQEALEELVDRSERLTRKRRTYGNDQHR